jgi:hypothetical protein
LKSPLSHGRSFSGGSIRRVAFAPGFGVVVLLALVGSVPAQAELLPPPLTVTISRPLVLRPDLVIDQAPAARPVLVIAAAGPGVRFTVKNQGNLATTTGSKTFFYLQGFFAEFATTVLAPPLNAGQSVQLVAPVPSWVANNWLTFSCNGIEIVADTTNVIAEANESNNSLSILQDSHCYF